MQPDFQQAQIGDLSAIMQIILQAQCRLASRSIEQWQDGYPAEQDLQQDILSGFAWILRVQHDIAALGCLVPGEEPSYQSICGRWNVEGRYQTVHRLAVADRFLGRGFASQMLRQFAKHSQGQPIAALRCDTHPDNHPMRQLLVKNGYTECGIIHLPDGAPRLAFDMPLNL